MKPKRHKYGNASQVTDHFADGGKVEKKAKPKPKAEPKMLGDGMAARAGNALQNRRAQIDAAVEGAQAGTPKKPK